MDFSALLLSDGSLEFLIVRFLQKPLEINSYQDFNKINIKPGIATEYPLEKFISNTKPCKL